MKMRSNMFPNGILTINIRGYIIKDRYFISNILFQVYFGTDKGGFTKL